MEGARTMPHLNIKPWLVALLVILELVLWISPCMVGTEGFQSLEKKEGFEILGFSVFSEIDLQVEGKTQMAGRK